MGRQRETNQAKDKSNWIRKSDQKTSYSNKYRETKKIIQKAKKEPLNGKDLIQILHKTKYFIGVFASDQLTTFSILKFPVYLIVNIDISTLKGSHWIALRIDHTTVEIIDSLGFKPSLWSFYPKELFDFLQSYSLSHRFLISPILQTPNSHECGLYCIYYILNRSRRSFRHCLSKFSRNITQNKFILRSLLLNFFS